MTDPVVVCGVVIDRTTGHELHVDITLHDPDIAELVRNKTLKHFSLDVTGPTPMEV